MIHRRTLFGATAAVASLVSSAFTGRKASAAKLTSKDYEPRGTIGRLERIPKLNVESRDDYLMGFRTWVQQDLWRAGRRRTNKILEEKGLDPRDDLPRKQIIDLVNNDPVIGMSVRTWMSCQKMTWQNFVDECHANADTYFDELEAADTAGPGTLELNPGIEPDYTKHEIHIMPGGYVGDPFAGYIFHYGTNNFYTYGTTGLNFQDGVHINYANQVPEPADGKVRRILDMGCSIGQYSVALKGRFPDAEVWGIDVGGPMVRYAHMRAADIGVDVNFAQRLAEDTKFPDGYFDIVTSYILHHEVTAEASSRCGPCTGSRSSLPAYPSCAGGPEPLRAAYGVRSRTIRYRSDRLRSGAPRAHISHEWRQSTSCYPPCWRTQQGNHKGLIPLNSFSVRLLEKKGITEDMIEAYMPSDEKSEDWKAQRDAYIRRVFSSLSNEGDMTLATGRDYER